MTGSADRPTTSPSRSPEANHLAGHPRRASDAEGAGFPGPFRDVDPGRYLFGVTPVRSAR